MTHQSPRAMPGTACPYIWKFLSQTTDFCPRIPSYFVIKMPKFYPVSTNRGVIDLLIFSGKHLEHCFKEKVGFF